MSDKVLQQRAQTLLALHQPGNPVILPTIWDAWSAKLAVDAGFAALTVGSHPLADSIGKADQEGMTFEDVLTRIKQITGAVDVPISITTQRQRQTSLGTITALFSVLSELPDLATVNVAPLAPDLPTVDEAGLPGFHIAVWTALWAPHATPRAIIDRLNAAVVEAVADPAVRKRLTAELGQDIPSRAQLTPEALYAYQKAEIEKWWPLIKSANIRPE